MEENPDPFAKMDTLECLVRVEGGNMTLRMSMVELLAPQSVYRC